MSFIVVKYSVWCALDWPLSDIFVCLIVCIVVQKVAAFEAAKDKSAGCLLQPPTPIIRSDNWPTLEVQKTTLQDLSAAEPEEPAAHEVYADSAPIPADDDVGQSWEDVGFDDGPSAMAAAADDLDFGDDDGAWGDDLDGLDDFGEPDAPKQQDEMAGLADVGDDSGFQMPVAGKAPAGCWVANSSHASDHIAAGGMASALQLLNRQIAASEFSVLKDGMLGCYLGSMMSVPGKNGWFWGDDTIFMWSNVFR